MGTEKRELNSLLFQNIIIVYSLIGLFDQGNVVSKWRLKHLTSKMNYSKTKHCVETIIYCSKYPLSLPSWGAYVHWTHSCQIGLYSFIHPEFGCVACLAS